MGKLKQFWQWLKRPSRLALGAILLIGFIAGGVSVVGFNEGLSMTNEEDFCISCHSMHDNVYQEYVSTIHFANRSGVRATCPDCHVPHEFIPKMVRKIQASKEVWSTLIGKVDTPQKFEDHRPVMAQREIARMKANDSQECRNCHEFTQMDLTMQSKAASVVHTKAFDTGQTCIDCHQGIAHKLPKDLTLNKAIH